MKVYSIYDNEFRKYGCVLERYDYTELFQNLEKLFLPDTGVVYVASDAALEGCSVAKEMEIRGFGAYPIQLGYVIGKASVSGDKPSLARSALTRSTTCCT